MKTMKREVQVKTDIKVKLLPRSSVNKIVGREGDVYRVKVTSAPVDGMANKSFLSLLAKRLKRPKGSIEIINGKSSRIKLVRVHGLSETEIAELLENK